MKIWTPKSARVFGNKLTTQDTLPSGTQARPVDLTLHFLKRRRRRSQGGKIVQELNSIREGKYWDNVKGGWLDQALIRKACEEEIQYVKKHAVSERSP